MISYRNLASAAQPTGLGVSLGATVSTVDHTAGNFAHYMYSDLITCIISA